MPGHAAGRPALRPHLAGRVAQQLRVGGDEDQVLLAGAQLDRADHPVAVLEADDLELVLVRRVVGHHPLDDALLGAERQARRGLVQRGQAQHPLVRRPATGTRRPAHRPRGSARPRCPAAPAGRSPTAAAAARPRSPRRRRRARSPAPPRRSRRACCACRRPPSGSRRSPCGPAARSRTAAPGTGRRRPPAAPRPTGAPAASSSTRAPRRCRTSWPPRPARRRPACAARRRSPGSGSARRSPRCSRSCSLSSSIRSNRVSRRSGVSRMYCGLDLGQREVLHQAAPWPAPSCRWTRISRDDLVDVEQRHQQAVDQVQPVAALGPPELAAPAHHVEPVVDDRPRAAPCSPRVSGCPSTSATLLMPKDSSIGVSL